MRFQPKFRVYDEKSDEIFVAEATAAQGDGEYISLGCREVLLESGGMEMIASYGPVEEEGLTFSWFTGWTDWNGDEVYGGDVVKRVQDEAAESQRKWLKEGDATPNLNEVTIKDYSGALGLVQWKPGGFTIKLIEGHKWSFYGPEGTLNANWDKEVEVIGNEFQNPELL